jgi:hypothetical protein
MADAMSERAPGPRTTPEMRQALRARYTSESVPPCRVCGGPLSPVASGGGHPTVWACETLEPDPDKPGWLRNRPGRGGAEETRRGGHFAASRIDWLRDGDPDVLALCDDADALAGALAEVARLRESLVDIGHLVKAWSNRPSEGDLLRVARMIDTALTPRPAENVPLDGPRIPLEGVEGPARANVPATSATEAS